MLGFCGRGGGPLGRCGGPLGRCAGGTLLFGCCMTGTRGGVNARAGGPGGALGSGGGASDKWLNAASISESSNPVGPAGFLTIGRGIGRAPDAPTGGIFTPDGVTERGSGIRPGG